MVGKRNAFSRGDSHKNVRTNGYSRIANDDDVRRRPVDDLERGHSNYSAHSNRNGYTNGNGNGNARPRPTFMRFQDAARTALEDRRRDELKKALLHNIDHDGLEEFRRSDEELKKIKNKKVRKFYEDQNTRLNSWLEVDAVVMAIGDDVFESMDPDPNHDGDMERSGGIQDVSGHVAELLPDEEKEKRAKAEKRAKWAININVIINIALLVGKIIAAMSTGSLSLIASLVDSALDLLCTAIIWSTNKLVQWRISALKRKFPVGRRRLEPIGILVFSIIMVISFLQILKESVEKLMPLKGEAEMLGTAAIAALLATIIVKGIIGIGCLPIKTTQVQALAQDCKTDVVFNTLSLLFPFIGAKANIWWLDPAGAGLLSLFIIYDWGHTCFENVTRLSGEAADEHTQQKLMYLAYRFSPVIDGVKNILVYHAGDGVWVEFDILLDPKTKLQDAHDISEALQYCAEGLEEVDRAFVSCDYSSAGPPGHNATD